MTIQDLQGSITASWLATSFNYLQANLRRALLDLRSSLDQAIAAVEAGERVNEHVVQLAPSVATQVGRWNFLREVRELFTFGESAKSPEIVARASPAVTTGLNLTWRSLARKIPMSAPMAKLSQIIGNLDDRQLAGLREILPPDQEASLMGIVRGAQGDASASGANLVDAPVTGLDPVPVAGLDPVTELTKIAELAYSLDFQRQLVALLSENLELRRLPIAQSEGVVSQAPSCSMQARLERLTVPVTGSINVDSIETGGDQ